MKLLRVTAQGLPLFKEKLDLSFYVIPLQFLYFRDTKPKLFSFILYFFGVTSYLCLNALIKWLQSQNPVSWLI